MSAAAPLAPVVEPPDPTHANWQLVLVRPTTNQAVLYSPVRRRFTVASAYPSSTHAASQQVLAPSSPGPTPPEGEEGADDSPLPLPSDEEVEGLVPPRGVCPLCYQIFPHPRTVRRTRSPLSHSLLPPPSPSSSSLSNVDSEEEDWTPRAGRTTVNNAVPARLAKEGAYFELLSEANSRAGSPSTTGGARALEDEEPREGGMEEERLPERQMNEGYYETFFKEVQLLGKGGQGSVYLARHVLNGENLGLYAVKKIRVGSSPLYLLSILREVHLLESISHPNIINYHHAWLETSPSTSPFVPSVPTLHVLMGWANGGSLEGFVQLRNGGAGVGGQEVGRGEDGGTGTEEGQDRKERWKRLHRNKAGRGMERAVHLLKVEDLLELFKDVVVGLGFLHSRNILHLDLKAENVLLHWDEDALLPRCMLSDFGSATADSYHRERHGGSGTLAYTPPESFLLDPKTGKLPSPDRATDQWALGLILHLLCFFALPWRNAGEEGDTRELEREIRAYRGFYPSDVLPPFSPKPSPPLSSTSSSPTFPLPPILLTQRHDLPHSLLLLLSSLINLSPSLRPGCEKVERALPGLLRDAKELEEAGGAYPPAEMGNEEGLVRYETVARRPPFLLAATGFNSEGGRTSRRRSSSLQPPIPRATRAMLKASSVSEGEDEASERERDIEEDEERWELLPPHSSPREMSRNSSRALTRSPRPSPPLALPSPPLQRALAPRKAHKQGILKTLVSNGLVRRQMVAALFGVGKVRFASTHENLGCRRAQLVLLSSSLTSPSSSSGSLPTWLALLLLIETAFDVAFADLRVTAGLMIVHVAVLRSAAGLM
ncbi:hypothetical protein JCM11251_005293 [Rhodosporidiobolus azoricus]